jgi:Flp pilus assembly pilin Flp
MWRFLPTQRFPKARRGAAALEFALVAPVFFILLIGVFDLSILFFLLLTLENAALDAARFGSTGAVPEDATRDERIREIVHGATMGLLDDKGLDIRMLVYESYEDVAAAEWLFDVNGNDAHDPGEIFDDVNGNGVWDGDPGVPGSGAQNEIVVYRVSAQYRLITPLMDDLIGAIPIRSAVPIRNEPF